MSMALSFTALTQQELDDVSLINSNYMKLKIVRA